MTITYAANDTVTLAVSGTAITMNGVACGAATTLNTNVIATAGTVTGNESLVISLTGGPFAPGLTAGDVRHLRDRAASRPRCVE